MEIVAAVAAVTLTAWLVVRRRTRRSEPQTYDIDPHVVQLLRDRSRKLRRL